MKVVQQRMLLVSLCCSATCIAADDSPTTSPTTIITAAAPAATLPATQNDGSDMVEMIPPSSHWPGVVVAVAGGMFALAAVIGPLVLAQGRRKAAFSPPGDEPVRGAGRKNG